MANLLEINDKKEENFFILKGESYFWRKYIWSGNCLLQKPMNKFLFTS
jgi:hypothetical protein